MTPSRPNAALRKTIATITSHKIAKSKAPSSIQVSLDKFIRNFDVETPGKYMISVLNSWGRDTLMVNKESKRKKKS